jgi:hypothetical protein
MADFNLNEKEVETLAKLEESVNFLHGKLGKVSYLISYTGIGLNVKVRFEDYGIEKDITDYDSW